MPTYEYRCRGCERPLSVVTRTMGGGPDAGSMVCEECGNTFRKVFHAPAVKLKGTGWFQTDYGNLDKQQAQGRRLEREKKIRPGHDLTRYESA